MRFATTLFCIWALITAANGQSEATLKQALEGKRVEILIEMPASSEGIDLKVDQPDRMNFEEYSRRIKKYGISLYPGDLVMITKIKKKNKHIEFQLAGGGYGTWGDDDSNVSADQIPKSVRQEELEQLLKDDKDDELENRKALEKEFKDLERKRSIAQKESNRQASVQSEMKKSRIQEQRLQGGSRFNIRYDYRIGKEELTLASIKEALSEYINFSTAGISGSASDHMASDTPNSLSKGLSMEAVIDLLGVPKALSTERKCQLEITESTFETYDQKVEATFVEGVLVKYAVMSK